MTIAVDLGSKTTKQPTNQIIFVRQLAVNQELSAEISQILVIENTTLTTFSMKHLVKRKVYTDVGGIKYLSYDKCTKISNTSCLLKQSRQTMQSDQGLPCLLF